MAAGMFALGLSSCNDPLGPNKNNPPAEILQAADFDITLLDHEQGWTKDSLYCFEGVWKGDAFYFGYFKLDPMVPNILPDRQNQLEFVISSEAAGFEGVNASSSSQCINIVQDTKDRKHFHLEYVAEGESTITFWNGEGDARKEISFLATSKAEIPIEGFLARVDGKEYKFTKNKSTTKVLKTFKYRNDFPGWDQLHIVEIVGPIPLNATRSYDTKNPLIIDAGWVLAYLDEDGNACNWDIYQTDDEIGSLREDDEEFQIKHFPDYRWFQKEISTRNNYAPLTPADLRERHLMMWSVKNKYSTWGGLNICITDIIDRSNPEQSKYIDYWFMIN
jgi:hypothetical protein